MSTDERERALALKEAIAALEASTRGDYGIEQADLLRDCVAIERTELERLRRALWQLWKRLPWQNYGRHDAAVIAFGTTEDDVQVFVEAGYLTEDASLAERMSARGGVPHTNKGYRPTPAAHEFAKEMKEREGA